MDKDTFAELWERLLDEGCDEAAAGLIIDLFRFLHYAETKWPTAVSAKFADVDREFRENRWGHLRELLMELLDDADGTKLQSWYRLHRDNLAAFRERVRQFARSKNDIHDSGLWIDGSEPSSTS